MVTRDGFVKILDFGLAKLVPGRIRRLRRDEPADDDARNRSGHGARNRWATCRPSRRAGELRGLSVGPVLARRDPLRDGVGEAGVRAPDAGADALGDHRRRAGAAGRGCAEDVDEPRLDRRAVPGEGSGGAVRLDEGPGARPRGAAGPLLGHLDLAASSPGAARTVSALARRSRRCRRWRSRPPRSWLSSRASASQRRRDSRSVAAGCDRPSRFGEAS